MVQLLVAPIIDRGDAPDWEAAWSPSRRRAGRASWKGPAPPMACCGNVPACVSPSTSPIACACRDNGLEPAGNLELVAAEACDKRGLCCNEEVDDACRGKVLMGRQVWDFDHDLTADKMCYDDAKSARACSRIQKSAAADQPRRRPAVESPCTYAWFFNDDDGVVTTSGPGNYTFPPGGTTEGWNDGDQGPGDVQREPLRLRTGHRRHRLLGGRLAEEGARAGLQQHRGPARR